MKRNTSSVLKEVLEKVNPSQEELQVIKKFVDDFLKKFEKRLKKLKINAAPFIGGSFAKKTLIKKNKYDVDIFVRFNKKYQDQDISKLTGKALQTISKPKIMKGSRNYFRINAGSSLFLEIVPVIEVKNPKESENITDLSYSHVNYVRKRVKDEKILDDIKIAKAFCYANQCYGAESYINGFSGYGLELLVYYYGGFLKFLRAAVKIKTQEIIDIEKQHKSKRIILMDINKSKLDSPIILIDPTFKHRNVLAALSEETFKTFQKTCKKFLKSPSIKSFEIQKQDLKKIEQNAKKRKLDFVLVQTKTKKQAGDIAATKLLKFQKHLAMEISKFFKIKNKGFGYDEKQGATYFFVAQPKKELLIHGPRSDQKKHFKAFKKKHKRTFMKSQRIYAREKVNFNLKKFLSIWKKKNVKKIKEMYISELN